MVRAECIALAVHMGDEHAIERLVHTYQDQLYGYALRLLRNCFDAEEVTQDALIRACRALALRYGPDKCRQLDLRPWLFRITRNLALNRLRDRRSAGEDRLSIADERTLPSTARSRERSQQLEILIDQDMLNRALSGLSTASREMVVLRFIEGLSYAEIANVTGCSPAAARGKVFRALNRLRALLAEGGSRCVVKQ